jgi:ABC-type Fe3+/spermidine/putrescine transport system ATPase subunit
MTLSDRIAVVNRGRFEQVGAPVEVYEKPATPFVGEFLGRTVMFEGTIANNHAGQCVELASGSGRLYLTGNSGSRFSSGEAVRVLTRPEDIEILPVGQLAENQIPARIEEVAYLGDHFEYQLQAGGHSFMLAAAKRERHAVGSEVRLRFDPDRLNIHPR